MPRGYRYAILAAFGWLILCGAKPPAEQPKSGNSAQYSAPSAKPSFAPAPDSTGNALGKFAPYPGYDPDPCYHAKDHDAADLCAQWRAAVAAEKAAHEARRSSSWSIVATILSALSLLAVAAALYLTAKSNDIARRAATIGARPWLSVDMDLESGFTPFGGGGVTPGTSFKVKRTCKNIGKTPALNVYGKHEVRIVPLGARSNQGFWDSFISDSVNHKYSGEVIFPDGIQSDEISFTITDYMLRSALVEDRYEDAAFQVWIYTSVSYKYIEIDDKTYYTSVRYRLEFDERRLKTIINNLTPVAASDFSIKRPNWACIKAT